MFLDFTIQSFNNITTKIIETHIKYVLILLHNILYVNYLCKSSTGHIYHYPFSPFLNYTLLTYGMGRH